MMVGELQQRELLQALDVRVGVDVENIADVAEAIQLHGDRYLRKLFTDQEVSSCGGRRASAEVLAPGLTVRFAAKEAVFKLLHLTTTVPGWREVEIWRAGGGWPEVELCGVAEQLAREAGFRRLSLSMSHGGGVGTATVIGIRWGGLDPQVLEG